MFRNGRLLGAITILLLVCLAVCLAFSLRKAPKRASFDLPDGTSIKFVVAAYGAKQVTFHDGFSWERIIQTFGPHPLTRYRNFPYRFNLLFTNAGFGIELRHIRTNGPLLFPVNGVVQLMQVRSTNLEISGAWTGTVFGTMRTKSGLNKVSTEDIYWLFPAVQEHDLRFRLYYTNAATQAVLTNEFSIPNPAF